MNTCTIEKANKIKPFANINQRIIKVIFLFRSSKMLSQAKWLMMVIAALLTLQSRGDGGIRLPDQAPKEEGEGRSLNFGGDRGRSVSVSLLSALATTMLPMWNQRGHSAFTIWHLKLISK